MSAGFIEEAGSIEPWIRRCLAGSSPQDGVQHDEIFVVILNYWQSKHQSTTGLHGLQVSACS